MVGARNMKDDKVIEALRYLYEHYEDIIKAYKLAIRMYVEAIKHGQKADP